MEINQTQINLLQKQKQGLMANKALLTTQIEQTIDPIIKQTLINTRNDIIAQIDAIDLEIESLQNEQKGSTNGHDTTYEELNDKNLKGKKAKVRKPRKN